MKKYSNQLIVFIIVWMFSTSFMYLLGKVLERSTFQNLWYITLLGLSIAFFGIFGPRLTDFIKRKCTRNSKETE